jgi:hypothetical protein
MDWTRGVLRLGVVVLLWWWGVRVLLQVWSRHADDRARDEGRVHDKRDAQRAGKGAHERWSLLTDVFVYTLLALVLGGALVWVVRGFVHE